MSLNPRGDPVFAMPEVQGAFTVDALIEVDT
jgi:hypothetical protein